MVSGCRWKAAKSRDECAINCCILLICNTMLLSSMLESSWKRLQIALQCCRGCALELQTHWALGGLAGHLYYRLYKEVLAMMTTAHWLYQGTKHQQSNASLSLYYPRNKPPQKQFRHNASWKMVKHHLGDKNKQEIHHDVATIIWHSAHQCNKIIKAMIDDKKGAG